MWQKQVPPTNLAERAVAPDGKPMEPSEAREDLGGSLSVQFNSASGRPNSKNPQCPSRIGKAPNERKVNLNTHRRNPGSLAIHPGQKHCSRWPKHEPRKGAEPRRHINNCKSSTSNILLGTRFFPDKTELTHPPQQPIDRQAMGRPSVPTALNPTTPSHLMSI